MFQRHGLTIRCKVTGFTDVAPVVREQTVKAVLTVVPKLSDRTINGELLRYLAKTANDEQPGIRTNTIICLGKIARSLGTNVSSLADDTWSPLTRGSPAQKCSQRLSLGR